MPSFKRLSGSSTSDLIHHGGFDFGEVTAVQEVADIADNLGTCTEDFAGTIIHDKIQVALTEAQLFVLETVVLGGNGVQTRGQEDDLGGEDGQLTVITVLRRSATRETDNTNDITSSEVLMLLLEWDAAGGILCLAHHLDLLALSTDVVENQLGTRGTLGVDTASNADRNIGLLLALLQTLVLLQEFAQVVGDLELVRIRVGVLGFEKLLNLLASDLKVLLIAMNGVVSLVIA